VFFTLSTDQLFATLFIKATIFILSRLPFFLHVRSADQLPSQLPSDITFEICSSSPSSPAAPASSVSSATHGGDDEGTGGTDTFVKTERIVSGVHFLTDRTEEDRTDLLLPKSEAGENEPEVRKQVGYLQCDLDFGTNLENRSPERNE